MKLLRWISSLAGRSLERPGVKLTDESAYDLLAAGTSPSGIAINPRTSLTWSPVWRGVNLISTSVAKLPLYIYRRDGNGKERDRDHPAFRLLRHKANAEQTALSWKQLMIVHALLHRGGYSYIDRDGNDAPRQLIPLDPTVTFPVRENGRLWYRTEIKLHGPDQPGSPRKLHPIDVFHVMGLSLDGLTGLSLIDVAKQSLGLGIAQERYGAIFFKNNGTPPVVLKHPKTLPPDKRIQLREQWLTMQAGIERAHLPALLENGLELQELQVKAADAQLIESKKFSLVDVANWLGTPVHKLGGEGRTAYASLEQENEAFLSECLDSWLCKIEEEAFEKLLREREKLEETHLVEFLRQALVRANLAVRAAYYRTALGGRPWLTQNEVRGMENLNPVEGGDEILEPLNMGKGGADNEEKPSQTNSELSEANEANRQALKKLARQLVVDAAGRMAKRLHLHAARAAKQSRTFPEFLDAFPTGHRPVVAEVFAPALAAVRLATSKPLDAAAVVDQFLRETAETYQRCYDTEPRANFAAAVEAAGIARAMDAPGQLADQLLREETSP